jgi:hypothetical protein
MASRRNVANSAARGFPAHFDPDGWEEDLARTTPAGRKAAETARSAYEQNGIPFEYLRSVEEEGRDGTVLPDCAKVYLPQPAGRFGMVFRAIKVDDRMHLACLAFGVRHPPKDSRRPTVYQLAHQRIHGQPPRRPS